MAKYIIKAKDGSGWVQDLVQNRNNKNKKIILITTTKSEAKTFSNRKAAKQLLRGNKFATSNYEFEFLESTGPRNLEFIGHKEFGEE